MLFQRNLNFLSLCVAKVAVKSFSNMRLLEREKNIGNEYFLFFHVGRACPRIVHLEQMLKNKRSSDLVAQSC